MKARYTYTDSELNQKGFLIPKYPISSGFLFWLTRKLWSLEPLGKNWQVTLYYVLFWLLIIELVIIADTIILIVVGTSHLIWFLLKELQKSTQKLLEKLFTKLLYPFVKTVLIFASVIALIIILIYRFAEIKTFILLIFDKL